MSLVGYDPEDLVGKKISHEGWPWNRYLYVAKNSVQAIEYTAPGDSELYYYIEGKVLGTDPDRIVIPASELEQWSIWDGKIKGEDEELTDFKTMVAMQTLVCQGKKSLKDRERLERIATAAMEGQISCVSDWNVADPLSVAKKSVLHAKALIEELDK